MNDIKETIIRKIQEGQVHMQPRWHFVLRTALIVVGTVLVALAVLYLFSFVLFVLHRNGLLFAPGLGMRGLAFFVMSSPWLLIVLMGAFLVTLYLLVKHYAFSYRRPLVYSILAIALFAIGGASTLHALSVQERIGVFAQQHNVPGMGPLYKTMTERRADGVTLGVVIELHQTGFTLETEDGEDVDVHVTKRTKTPRGLRYDVDDTVFVFGDRDGDTITAFGVRPVSGNSAFPRPGGRGPGMMRGAVVMPPLPPVPPTVPESL